MKAWNIFKWICKNKWEYEIIRKKYKLIYCVKMYYMISTNLELNYFFSFSDCTYQNPEEVEWSPCNTTSQVRYRILKLIKNENYLFNETASGNAGHFTGNGNINECPAQQVLARTCKTRRKSELCKWPNWSIFFVVDGVFDREHVVRKRS